MSHPHRLQPKPHALVHADGRFVPVAAVAVREKARVFAEEVAKAQLIRTHDDDDGQKKPGRREPRAVHPIARASGQLRSQCLDELSKAVNLAGLVLGGEYIELQHVLQNEDAPNGTDTATSADKEGDSSRITRKDKALDPHMTARDTFFRAQFVLQRKQAMYSSCRDTLLRHATTSFVATALYHSVLDRHMLKLRQRGWKLTLPLRQILESSRKRMISPREIPALQLNIYRTEILPCTQLHHQAVVAKYATVEIDDDRVSAIANHPPVSSHRRPWKKRRTGSESLFKKEDAVTSQKDDSIPSSPTRTKIQAQVATTEYSTLIQIHPITGNTSRQQSNIYRTLVFQLEDTTNGHVLAQELELAHSHPQGEEGDDVNTAHWTLEVLQHSLFCTQLFECLRDEVLVNTHSNMHKPSATPSSILWLSSAISDAGIPTPALMVDGKGPFDDDIPLPPFTVVYCHLGEFKILFNAQYSFIVTLKEYPTNMTAPRPINKTCNNHDADHQRVSLVLRLLLFHAQSVYHFYRKDLDASSSTAPRSPRILQSSLALGMKCFLQHEIRSCIQRIRKWIQVHVPDKEFQVIWLPISVMEHISKATISLGNSFCCDVSIVCDRIKVISMNEHGGYHCVDFFSSFEWDLYLRAQLLKVHEKM